MIEVRNNRFEKIFENSFLFRLLAWRPQTTAERTDELLYYKAVTPLASLEDKVNTITHALGILFSAVSFYILFSLTVEQGNRAGVLSSIIFCSAMALVYGASTLYHSLYRTMLRNILRMIDHVSIFVLIAGSFTPFILVCLPTAYGYSLLGLVYLMAVVGIYLKLKGGKDRPFFFVSYYLVMGWLGVFAIYPLAQVMPLLATLCLIGGGLSYSIGVIFFSWNTLKFNHGIWHLFVLTGSVLHFVAVYTVLVSDLTLV